jgi:hypothetical protein
VIPGHDALDNYRSGFRSIALPDEFFAGREFPDFATQAADRSNIGGVYGRVVLEFSQKDIGRRHFPDLTQFTPINVGGRFPFCVK